MFDIKENLKQLPDSPGVYIHKDRLGRIIYVGKAISLKNRVRQYFQSSKNMDPKVRAMVSHIEEFEYITTGSEMEAFILECNLIKKHMPKYNVLLRDDKTYPYIKVTSGEDFPRILKTRNVTKDGSKYFGPYSDAAAVNQMVDLLRKTYTIKQCSAKSFPSGFRPCLNYHMGICEGICTGNVDKDQYRERVDLAVDFLKGKNKSVTAHLKEKMQEASENLDFESAAKYRDFIIAADALHEKQRVVLHGKTDMDVVMTVGGEKERHIVLFFVRDGKLSGRESYSLQSMKEDSSDALVSAFIKQYYEGSANIPREILVQKTPAEKELIERYLSDICCRQVRITAPQKGEKRALLELVKKDVAEITKNIDQRAQNKKERAQALGAQIHEQLAEMGYAEGAYNGEDYRVEAYDISNTNGVDTVGAMVVFEGLSPRKKDYRRFKVRTAEGPDDYGSMQEILYRRFKRALEDDPGFNKYPHLLLIDGGRGHVSAAIQILKAIGLENLPVAGMVKDDSHRTRALVYLKGEEICEKELGESPLLFKYIGTVQEEVHRFAIEYHRGLRDRKGLKSVLDDIEGIGPAKRNALLAHFKSVENIKKASPEELQKVKGITETLAEKIREYFFVD